MSIIKTKRNINFTTIPNSIVNDKRLQWNDLGLLVYLLSKPETWSVRVDALVNEKGIGRDAVYGMLKRLRAIGYASLIRYADGSTEWTILDEPYQENQDLEKPDQENPDLEKPHVLVKKEVKKRKSISKEIKDINKANYFLGVSDQVIKDFTLHRKNKKAAITETAINGIKREAIKAGITLEAALIECCERGWVGFKADWYNNKASPQKPVKFNASEYLQGHGDGYGNPTKGNENGIIEINPKFLA